MDVVKVAGFNGGGDRVIGGELLCGAGVDEATGQAATRQPALGSNVTKGVPRRKSVRGGRSDPVLESSEGSPTSKSWSRRETTRRREWIDENQIQLVTLDGVLYVDARSVGLERHLAVRGSIQPSALPVRLIC